MVIVSLIFIIMCGMIAQPINASCKLKISKYDLQNIHKNTKESINGWSEGNLYINDCGQPHGGFEYCGKYYANLSLHKGLGTLAFTLQIGIGDVLTQHNFSIELLSYTAEEIHFLLDGNIVIMEKIETDDIWETWDHYYIASYGSGLPNRSGIGVISPDYFPGLTSFNYVELRFPGISSFTLNSLDVVGESTNVSYGYGINNNGKCVGSSGENLGLHDAVIWEHEYRPIQKDGLWGLWSRCQAINDKRSIVGSSHTLDGIVHGIIWRYDEVKIDIGSLGGNDCVSYGYDINNNGGVVGMSYIEPNQWQPPHGFLFYDANNDGVSDPGEMIDLGTLPGDDSSVARGINDGGMVVGTSSYNEVDGTYSHPFIWDDSSGMQPLFLIPGDVYGHAYDINSFAQVVGYSYGIRSQHACLWVGSDVIDLVGLGGSKACAYAINDKGDVAGSSTIAGDSKQHACMWKWNEVYDLNTLISPNTGWELIEAYDMNNQGQIVGYGIDPSGDIRGFVLTPDTGFTLEPKYTYIRSYQGGGGVFVLQLLHGDDFAGDISLSLSAPAELNACLFTDTLNRSCPIAEVMVYPELTMNDGEYYIELIAEKADIEFTVVLQVNITEVYGDDPWFAIIKFNEYLPYLGEHYPELGDLSLENWEIFHTYTNIWIVEHWTFLSENWEIRLKIHATIPPHNWTKLWIRPRGDLMEILILKHEYDGLIYEIPPEEFETKYGY